MLYSVDGFLFWWQNEKKSRDIKNKFKRFGKKKPNQNQFQLNQKPCRPQLREDSCEISRYVEPQASMDLILTPFLEDATRST